jgi:hypothetical protein
MTCTSRPALALLLGASLAGCPLPQTLPEYPTSGTITPPRIQADRVTPVETVLSVDPACAVPPTFVLGATLVDENTYEKVEARWFVDYDPAKSSVYPVDPIQIIAGPADGLTIERRLDDFSFQPYRFDPLGSELAFRSGGGLHVVELVVSNNFAPESPPPVPAHDRPWRTPLRTSTQLFETQVQRWVFHYAPGGLCANP